MHKKGDKAVVTNYRLQSISPLLARYASAAFGKQIQPILESFFGDHQHGFMPGRSTTKLLQILESTMTHAIIEEDCLLLIQSDVSKAFDKIAPRGSLVLHAASNPALGPGSSCFHFGDVRKRFGHTHTSDGNNRSKAGGGNPAG